MGITSTEASGASESKNGVDATAAAPSGAATPVGNGVGSARSPSQGLMSQIQIGPGSIVPTA